MKKQSTFQRLLSYMLAYKWLTLSAFAFVFLTTLVTTALPLLARTYIDQLIYTARAFDFFRSVFIFKGSPQYCS